MTGHFNITPAPRPGAQFGNANPTVTGAEYEGDYYFNIATGTAFKFTAGAWVAVASDSGIQTLAATFNTTSGTAVDITGLGGFTPVVGATYDLEWFLLVRSASTAIGVQPSWGTPTGLDHFAYAQWIPAANYTNEVSQWGGPIVPSGAAQAPAANLTFGSTGQAACSIGAAPGVGNIRPRIQAEVGGNTISVMPGSWFRWTRTS